MEEASRLIARERKAGESLAVIPAPAALPWDQMPREPHLLDYFIILRKHQWLVLTFLLTVVTVVTIASFKTKPVYQAAARVEVDREAQNIVPFQDPNSYGEYVDMENYIETQSKILQSETLALQTIKALDLGRYPEFGGTANSLTWAQGAGASRRRASTMQRRRRPTGFPENSKSCASRWKSRKMPASRTSGKIKSGRSTKSRTSPRRNWRT